MKKRLVTLVAVVMVLSVLIVPVQAGPPVEASGLWQYKPYILEQRMADGNTFLKTFEEGKWTGTLSGTSTEDGKVVIHRNGDWSFNAIVSFEGTVDGKSGTLEMSVVGKRPDGAPEWEGKWVILSGTGELATLRGQGTWWGPGAPEPETWGDIYYAGKVHFGP
jgi:hypothetical protein